MTRESTAGSRAPALAALLMGAAAHAHAHEPAAAELWSRPGIVAHLTAVVLLAVIGTAALLWRRMLRRESGHAERLKRELAERAAAEDALMTSQRLLDAVFNGSMDALCIVEGTTRRILDCNLRAMELFECDGREELLGLTGHSLAVMEIPDDTAERAYQTVDAGQTWGGEFEFRTMKGGTFWGALAIVRLELSDRRLLLARISDITASRRAEKDRVLLSAAIEQAMEAIVITDARGTVEYVNPAFERVSGFSRDEAVGRPTSVLKSGLHGREFYDGLWRTISEGRVWFGHIINRRKDGSLYEEEGSITPVRDAVGRIVNYVAVKRDVTRELQIEAHLRQQQKLESIGTLASGVAHEINNPLTGIINYAQFIADDPEAGDEARSCGAEIVKEAERVAGIVRDLLSFARQDARKAPVTEASMAEIVRGTLTLVRALVRHDGILLEVDIPADLPTVVCRPQQIQQVLLNLLTNARDALNNRFPGSHPDKRIRIRAAAVGSGDDLRVRTTVEDLGTGIAPDVRERMFDPFFTTKPKHAGTGLGLSISHGIAREHRGDLTAEALPGQPTRFHLDLPAAGSASMADSAHTEPVTSLS